MVPFMSSRSMERQAGTAAELSYISRALKQWTLNGPRPRMVIAGSQLSRESVLITNPMCPGRIMAPRMLLGG
jgi:hypothetical protein